jgi:hypothetical protein
MMRLGAGKRQNPRKEAHCNMNNGTLIKGFVMPTVPNGEFDAALPQCVC